MSEQVKKHSDLHLPEEIWNIILLKLPLQAIVVCTGVCKSWNSLIKTSTFISSHLNNSITEANSTNLCFCKDVDSDTSKPKFSLLLDDEDLTKYTRLMSPLLNFDNELDVFGSCNGLILIGECSRFSKKLFLWNPVVRKLVMLPPLVHWKKYHFAGLGFDHSANDYIVMALYLSRNRNVNIGIYSLKSNSWKFLKAAELGSKYSRFNAVCRPESMAFVNGFFHVTANRMSDDESFVFLRFDMHDGSCREIVSPDNVLHPDDDNVEADFSVRSGLLAFSFTTRYSPNDRVFNIWVMEENGVESTWTQLVKFRLELSMPEPLLYCFRRNGDALLYMGKEVTLLNPRSKALKNIAIIDENSRLFFDCCYVQSLALLDIGDGYREDAVSVLSNNDTDANDSEDVFETSNDSDADDSEDVFDLDEDSDAEDSEDVFDLSEDSDSDDSEYSRPTHPAETFSVTSPPSVDFE